MFYEGFEYKARAAKGLAGHDRLLLHSSPTWPKGGLCPRGKIRVVGLDPSWSVHISVPALPQRWYTTFNKEAWEAGTLDAPWRIINQIRMVDKSRR